MQQKSQIFQKSVFLFSALIFVLLSVFLIICLFCACSPIFTLTGHSQKAVSVLRIAKITSLTFYQAFLSLFVAILIGVPAAFFCGKRNFFGRKFLLSLSAIPVCMPALIIALGYITFFGRSGILNQFINSINSIWNLKTPSVNFLYTFFGLILTQGFYNFPLVMSTVSDAWSRLPNEQAESARLLGSSEWRIFRTITLFQLMPAIVSACIPVFIYCFFSFMLVLLFGGIGITTLEVEIYQAVRNTLDFRFASSLALTETLSAGLVVALYAVLEKRSSVEKGLNLKSSGDLKKIRGPAEKIFFGIVIFLIMLFFLAPLAGIIFNAFSSANRFDSSIFYNLRKILSSKSFFKAFRWTFFSSLTTGFLCTTAGFFYAIVLRKSRSAFLKSVSMLPMAISGIVTGLGLMILFRRGNFLILVLAQSALIWPMAFRQIFPYILKIPESTVDAARILSPNPMDLIFKIYLPVCKRGIFSAFGFCFAISAGDTSLPLILSIPNFDTLALFTYRLAGSYKFNEACMTGLILASLCTVVFGLAKRICKSA
ncbi:ABC transporter permease [Treponema zioleckii]|uniref:ABC transporter permease n=1 Tax=Treponema zioleckii TaxID=331680 RepID=UPI00168AD5B3|nr:iron ABC transporter permease [Treponema zioleckii]